MPETPQISGDDIRKWVETEIAQQIATVETAIKQFFADYVEGYKDHERGSKDQILFPRIRRRATTASLEWFKLRKRGQHVRIARGPRWSYPDAKFHNAAEYQRDAISEFEVNVLAPTRRRLARLNEVLQSLRMFEQDQ